MIFLQFLFNTSATTIVHIGVGGMSGLISVLFFHQALFVLLFSL